MTAHILRALQEISVDTLSAQIETRKYKNVLQNVVKTCNPLSCINDS